MSSENLLAVLTKFQTVCPWCLSYWFTVDEEDLEAELEALADDLALEEELKEEEGAVPSYLEGVKAPDAPIQDKGDGMKDGTLKETV